MEENKVSNRYYIAIDLKSHYASCECVARGLDPLSTNLVVADSSRTEKTICLAVTPSLKAYGIPGRPRLFEVIQKVKELNNERLRHAPLKIFSCKSWDANEIKKDPEAEIDFIIAPPRMAYYMKVSTQIYQIYLRYIAPEDIHVYSIDEVFIDATPYLFSYNCSAHELAIKMIKDVLTETGITATAGIGTNLYLAKIAMDIVAKRMPADEDGVRIAELNEKLYRSLLWEHQPLTDFWRVGKGYAKKLESKNIRTMGDIAKCSLNNEEMLYKLFGINAELLIDHAWGVEPCTIADIKAFTPETRSISQGQVLTRPYGFEKAKLIVREMTELLVLELVEKKLVTDQIVLTIGYDIENKLYKGEMETDRYGRRVPKQAHGSVNIGKHTSSAKTILKKTMELFDRIVNPDLMVRRMYVVANHTLPENSIAQQETQISFYDDIEKLKAEEQREKKERDLQETVISLRNRFGKNSVIKGMNLQDGATTIERNQQIGGHKAGNGEI